MSSEYCQESEELGGLWHTRFIALGAALSGAKCGNIIKHTCPLAHTRVALLVLISIGLGNNIPGQTCWFAIKTSTVLCCIA